MNKEEQRMYDRLIQTTEAWRGASKEAQVALEQVSYQKCRRATAKKALTEALWEVDGGTVVLVPGDLGREVVTEWKEIPEVTREVLAVETRGFLGRPSVCVERQDRRKSQFTTKEWSHVDTDQEARVVAKVKEVLEAWEAQKGE